MPRTVVGSVDTEGVNNASKVARVLLSSRNCTSTGSPEVRAPIARFGSIAIAWMVPICGTTKGAVTSALHLAQSFGKTWL